MADEANQRKLQVDRVQGETDQETVARIALTASVHAMSTRQTFMPDSQAGFADHVAALERQIKQVQKGDMSAPEAMLMAQAATLDAMFNCMAQDAFRFIGKNGVRAEASMRAALKAQSQCASTIRVLGELKHPRQIVVAKQANVAQHQQINHGVTQADLHARAHGTEPDAASNELLTDNRSAQHAATLDTRTKGRAGRRHKALAAVDVIDRAEDA
jgi:hypothetical protein